jgi:hypothetical protein
VAGLDLFESLYNGPLLEIRLRETSCFQHPEQTWREPPSRVSSTACAACRCHHHVTLGLHRPRGLSPPRRLPSVRTRACCSPAGQDSYNFTFAVSTSGLPLASSARRPPERPSVARGSRHRVSTVPGTSVLRDAVAGIRDVFTRQSSQVRASPSEESHPHTAPDASHRYLPGLPGLSRLHSLCSLLAVVHTLAGAPSTSRSSSVCGTEPRSSVSTGLTKLSPSMGFPSFSALPRSFRSPPRFSEPHPGSRTGSPTHAPDTSGGRRASGRLDRRGSPPWSARPSLSCAASRPPLQAPHRSVLPVGRRLSGGSSASSPKRAG